ncbi:hypothetical protein V6N13_013052 [Hibiscus sabdariffa]
MGIRRESSPTQNPEDALSDEMCSRKPSHPNSSPLSAQFPTAMMENDGEEMIPSVGGIGLSSWTESIDNANKDTFYSQELGDNVRVKS